MIESIDRTTLGPRLRGDDPYDPAADAHVQHESLHVGGFVPFTSHRLPGRARRRGLLPGLSMALRLLPQSASHSGARRRRARLRGDPALARDATRPPRRGGVLRRRAHRASGAARRHARVRALGFGSACTRAAPIRGASRQSLPHVDWVGLDIKAPRAHYADVTGVAGSGDAPLASLELVRGRGVAFEVRTTVHPAAHAAALRSSCSRASSPRAASSAGSCSRSARPAAPATRWSPRRREASASTPTCSRGSRRTCRSRSAGLGLAGPSVRITVAVDGHQGRPARTSVGCSSRLRPSWPGRCVTR